MEVPSLPGAIHPFQLPYPNNYLLVPLEIDFGFNVECCYNWNTPRVFVAVVLAGRAQSVRVSTEYEVLRVCI